MKKYFWIILLFLSAENNIFSEENMHPILKNTMEYYFEELIPKYYKGQEDFSEESHIMAMEISSHMQGNGFSEIINTDNLVFDFYYLINHSRQDVQVLLISREKYKKNFYEYWIVKISDHGTPYNYAFFYLTKTKSKESKREVIEISKKYKDCYIFEDDSVLDLSFKNMITLYVAKPELKIESFKDTKYENKIVKWRNNQPYLKDMNFWERIYYKNKKKSTK